MVFWFVGLRCGFYVVEWFEFGFGLCVDLFVYTLCLSCLVWLFGFLWRVCFDAMVVNAWL